ncbi:MAG TPA: response regulator transcription factor [Dehalococcoidales bacterium]|nr:MAG: DNA-binding response regulator [Chloroflexi bacterium RBG_16_60_22]HJX14030.1 response regulator transcription factor [Dehalococcoidales bacterium]
MSKIRVLIADDHAIVREGIRMILAAHEDIEVVGEAADGRETIAEVGKLEPDVVLMDIAMPGLGGLEATLEITKSNPKSKVLVLTQYDDSEYIYRFLRAGAAGYVLKKTVGSDLVSAIRSVAQGKSFIDPAIADKVIRGYLEHPEAAGDESLYDRLSDREKTVLKLIAEGYTSRQIAETLFLSVKTVMTHRANIMEKLGLHNRAELIKYAIRQGLISPDS